MRQLATTPKIFLLCISFLGPLAAAYPAIAQTKLRGCPKEQAVSQWDACYGSMTYSDGEKYEGEFRSGRLNGQGTYRWPNGEKYVGEFQDGRRNGLGVWYNSDGSVRLSGIFRSGLFVEPRPVNQPASNNNRPSTVPESNVRGDTYANPAGVGLIKEAGTFKVPVKINNVLELHFTVDSGASDVSIPADVVLTLIRTGTIRDSDFIGEQTYVLADGSRTKSKTFRIRQLTVGNKTIENVKGSIADVNGSLLLGQSFLSRFNRVSFDYNQGVLLLD